MSPRPGSDDGPLPTRVSTLRMSAQARNRLVESTAESSIGWTSMACLFVAAGASVLASVALGVDDEAREGFVAGLGIAAILVGAVLFALASRLGPRWAAPALMLGLILVSLAVLAAGEPDTPYTMFYIWVGVEAWFFLGARRAAALTGGAVVLSAGVMFGVPSGGEGDAGRWWIMVMTSLLAMSGLTAVLHARVAVLVDELQRAATRDPLTRLLNRRGYQERLRHELARSRRLAVPLTIILADLDAFKQLNDRFGHREGDAALRGFAELCRTRLRDVDLVSRVGGEEFAIVLPGTSQSGALVVAERLRRAAADELRAPDGSAVTASFGIAAFPQHGSDGEVLLDHADQAMYAAKKLGRDRVAVFSDELVEGAAAHEASPNLEAVLLLAEALDLRDAATKTHSETVAALAAGTARALGLDADHVERIRLAGLLHDVGKIGVPDDILRKPGKLTADEWDQMRKHPALGARIVGSAGLHDIARWVLAHHERPDGGGYPHGLDAEEIPLEAQILAVADAYEAMTADRPYRAALAVETALAELERCAGTQFVDAVVDAFVAHVETPAAPACSAVAA